MNDEGVKVGASARNSQKIQRIVGGRTPADRTA